MRGIGVDPTVHISSRTSLVRELPPVYVDLVPDRPHRLARQTYYPLHQVLTCFLARLQGNGLGWRKTTISPVCIGPVRRLDLTTRIRSPECSVGIIAAEGTENG